MISIVIPNYNGEALLRKNLPKVLRSVEGYKHEVIVVDDASKDKSLEFLKNQKVKVLRNIKNLGFSSTVNKGVREANGNIVVLLNSDAYPQKDFLNFLVPHFEDPNVFAVGCLDKSKENGRIVLRGRGIGSWKKGFLVHGRGEINKQNTLWASGGSSAFRESMWQALGGLNEIYNPFYWEDIDLSYRALKSGYKILFEKQSVVYHEHEKGAIKQKYSNFKVRRVAYRNQIIFVWENATDLSLQFLHVIYLPYHLIKAVLRGDFAFLLGFLDAFVLLPKIIQSSFKSQRQFIRTDKEVIREFT